MQMILKQDIKLTIPTILSLDIFLKFIKQDLCLVNYFI